MTVLLLILEVIFACLLLAGVAVIYWPAALILAGVLGVIACERADAGQPRSGKAS